MKIIFVFKNTISIYNVISNENIKDVKYKNIDLDDDLKILEIKPYKNTLIELYENVFLICRFVNKILILNYGTQKLYIEWPKIVTAIELYSHDELKANNNIIHINKVLIGDEEGNLSLIEIETEYNEKKKEMNLNSLSYIHKKYKLFYSYINEIIYNKRLNVVISSSNEGSISINNGFSFENINIIELNNNLNILEFKLSEYDLLYIYTKMDIENKENKYNIYCYTLNGIKVSELNTENEYINYFTNNNGIIAITKKGDIYEYNCATLKELETNIGIEEEDNIKNKEIIYCMNSPKLNNIFIIFNKDIKIIRLNNKI